MMFLRRVLNKNPFPSIFPIQAFRFYKCRRYPKCTMTFTKKEKLEYHEKHELCVPLCERKGYMKEEEEKDSDSTNSSTGKNKKGKGRRNFWSLDDDYSKSGNGNKGNGRRSFWSLIWNLSAVDDDYTSFSSSVSGQIGFKVEDLITRDYLVREKDNLA